MIFIFLFICYVYLNICEAIQKKCSGKSFAVSQYDMDGVFIKSFPNGANASLLTGVHKGNLSQCLQGSRAHAGRFIWKPCLEYTGEPGTYYLLL